MTWADVAAGGPTAAQRAAMDEEGAKTRTEMDEATRTAPDTATEATKKRLIDGAAFILDATLNCPSLWGDGEQVLWPELEAMYITGGPGVGKTTIAQQLVLAAIGLGPARFLGLSVARQDKILYLAMDRPRQIAKSFARMVSERDRAVLAERLVIWKGPPPQDIAKDALILIGLAATAGASTIVLDSLKDAALGLSNDDVGGAVNRAIQTCLVNGVNVIVLHHQIKRSGDGGGGKPLALADMYGSAWLGAGAGSVVLIHGDAGDTIVELRHLKTPAEPVGPLKIEHDHIAGISRLADDQVDPLEWLRKQHDPVTAHHLAALYADPGEVAKRKHVERARRDLNRLTREGFAIKTDGTKGGTAGGLPDTFRPAARPHQMELPKSDHGTEHGTFLACTPTDRTQRSRQDQPQAQNTEHETEHADHEPSDHGTPLPCKGKGGVTPVVFDPNCTICHTQEPLPGRGLCQACDTKTRTVT